MPHLMDDRREGTCQVSLRTEGIYHINGTPPPPIYVGKTLVDVESSGSCLPQTCEKSGKRHRRTQALNRGIHITRVPKILQSRNPDLYIGPIRDRIIRLDRWRSRPSQRERMSMMWETRSVLLPLQRRSSCHRRRSKNRA